MAEFEELKLEVSLVDNASPQIDLLRRNIKELSSTKSEIASLRTETAAFGEQLKRLSEAVARGPEAWLKFAASFGAVGVAVEAVGSSMFSLSNELRRFGDEMLKIDVVAKRAGVDPGTVQNFNEIARTVGISAENVNRELIQMRQNIGASIELLTAQAQRVAYLPGGAEIFRRLQENLRTTHIAEEQAMLIKRSVEEYVDIVAKSAHPELAARVREQLGEIYGPKEIIERFPHQIEEISAIRKQIAEREAAASKEVVKLQGEIINNFNAIFGMLKINIMEDTLFGQSLLLLRDTLKSMREDMEKERKEKRERQERGEPEPSPWFGKRGPEQFLPWNWGDPAQKGKIPIWEWFKGKIGGSQQQQGGATEPQRLMGGNGVAGFTGPYAGMTPESWKGAADWAEQLHGEYSTNIERRDLMNDQNDETKKLIEQIRRTNALLSGEEQPANKLGLLTTQMGGLRAGLGGGIGTGYGAVTPPTGPTTAGPTTAGPRTTTDGRPAGPFPPGTHGGPGGPPITPTAPGGTIPATLPGAVAPLGYPTGGFTPVPDLTTPSGQRPTSAGGDVQLPGGSGSSAIYNKLLAAYQNSSVVGTIPKDGARYGFKTGSAEEWARFGMIIAAAESDYNPKTAVSNAKEQSFGIFQYNHPQVPGGNAFDVDASIKQFVSDSESSMKSHGGFTTGSILNRRFSTIQNTPPPTRSRQADAAIAAARRQGGQPTPPTAAPSVVTTARTRPSQSVNIPSAALEPTATKVSPQFAGGDGQEKLRGGSAGIRPELYDVIREASKSLPPGYYAQIESGKEARPRGGEHPRGNAGDVRIYGPDGKPVGGSGGWYQNPATFHLYEQFAQAAKVAQTKKYPEASFVWGGYFANRYSGTGPMPYGTADLMHMQWGGAMGGGSFETGATGPIREWLQRTGGISQPISQFTGTVQIPGATQVAGPSQIQSAPSAPKIEMLNVRPTTSELPTTSIFGGETEEEKAARRQRAIAHMTGWKGLPSEPETEWQMRGGDFGARARARRRAFARDDEVDRSMIDRVGAGGLMRRRLLGTGKIDVTVKSKGQESVSQEKPFKPVKWHRHTQMQEADHGPAISHDAAGGDPGAGPG